MSFPLLVFVASFALMAASAWVGDALRKRAGVPKEDERSDTGLLLTATLTLLFLIIGFSFSMAINRYDLRKNCEQAEAIAIGTEYSRADLLAAADAAKVQTLLKRYLDQRMLFYTTRSPGRAFEITADTVRLQTELWSTLRPAIAAVALLASALAVLLAGGAGPLSILSSFPIKAEHGVYVQPRAVTAARNPRRLPSGGWAWGFRGGH